MTEKITKFDPAEYLNSEEDIEAYLEAAMEEAGDDPKFIASVLNDIARARNMSQLAADTGMTRAGLYRALSEDGNPSLKNVARIAKALGLKLTLKPA